MSGESTTESIPLPVPTSALSSVLSDDLSLDSYLDSQSIEKGVQLDDDSNFEKLPDYEDDPAISAAVEAAEAAVEAAEAAAEAAENVDENGSNAVEDISLREEDLNLPDDVEDLNIPEEDPNYLPAEGEEEDEEDGGSEASDEESEEESEEGDEDGSGDEEEEEEGDEEMTEATDIEAPPDLTSIIDGPEPVAMDTDLPADIPVDLLPKPSCSEEVKEKKTEKKSKKRKKKQKGEKKAKKAKRKSGNIRRNIRSIIKEDELDAETLAAQNEEFERKKRLQEIQKSLLAKSHGQKATEEKEKDKDKDSQLKSLLQMAEQVATKAESDVVILDEEDKKPEPEKEKDIIDISSDEDCMVVEKEEDKEEEEIEEEDMNNGGGHINDELNCADEQGRVLINIGHPATDPDIFLSDKVAKNIKPHQIGGVRFLYDNLVESLSRFSSSGGFGCILAHSMGLGKTIQMIGFIDIFLRYTDAKTALCIVPINTLQNWMYEFNHWVPIEPPPEFPNSSPRPYKVLLMNDNYKTTAARAKLLKEWTETGGVLLMGYEMYRLLSSRRSFPTKPKKSKKTPTSQEPEVIDVDEEDKNKSLMTDMQTALVNPGPDVVVCDEGHRIKNSHTGISHSLKNIKTRRRVVLTGYPLQNNLMEYWCMVDFVRPNFLGTKTEFSNMFERPIMNGQCSDSTLSDIKLMRHRAYVLHSLLEGFVQRRGHTVLQTALPPKSEHVFLIKMSKLQRQLYNKFMTTIEDAKGDGTYATMNALKAFAVCCKIWNHPDILHKLVSHQKNEATPESDLDIDTEGGGPKKKKPNQKAQDPEKNVISYDWAHELMKDYKPGLVENGGKIEILFSIVEQSLSMGEKIIVFSQSLFTLNLIEDLLSQIDVPRPDMQEKWAKNKSYFRLDGSTPGTEREKLINQFNDRENRRCWLFLLSTRAGCLGINLIGANRVVVLDASWNPCHDCQAVCRVYRFGQDKNSYIYRLVTDNSLEKKIYDRQVTKQGMADRVVDELNPENQFTQNQVGNLLHYQDKELPDVDFSNVHENFKDPVLVRVLQNKGHWFSKEPFTHESLLIDKKELRLSKREKQLAKEAYARDKKMNISYTRPSYAAFYPRGPSHTPMSAMGPYIRRVGPSRPVASVKPMISTPVPMRLKADGKTPIGTIVRPGVTVHQVITTTDIVLPGNNTNTQAGMPRRIPAGQQVLVIKTLKGVYIRTSDGKLFAVRSKTPGGVGGVAGVSGVPTTATSGVITLSTSKASGALAGKPKTTCTTIVIPRTKNLNSNAPTSIKIVRPNITLKAASAPGSVIVTKPSAGSAGTSMLASIYSQTQAVNKIINKSNVKSNNAKSDTGDKPKISESGESSQDFSASNSPRFTPDSQPVSGSSSPSVGEHKEQKASEFGVLGILNSGRWTKPNIVVQSSPSSSASSSVSSSVVSVSALASKSPVSMPAPSPTSSQSPAKSSPPAVSMGAVSALSDKPTTPSTQLSEPAPLTPAFNQPQINTQSSTLPSAPPMVQLQIPPPVQQPPVLPSVQTPVQAPMQAPAPTMPTMPSVPQQPMHASLPPHKPQPVQNNSPPSTLLDLDSMRTTTVRPLSQSKPSQPVSQVPPVYPQSTKQNPMQMGPNSQQADSTVMADNSQSSSFSISNLTNNSSNQMRNQYGNQGHMTDSQHFDQSQSSMQPGHNQSQNQSSSQFTQSQPSPHQQYQSQVQAQNQSQPSRQNPMAQSQFPTQNSQSHSQPGMQQGSMFGNPLAHLTAQFGSSHQPSGVSMSPYLPKPMYPGHTTSSQDSASSQASNSEDTTMSSQMSTQRGFGDADSSMNYNNSSSSLGFGGGGGSSSNSYYNMGSSMSHQGHSGSTSQQMMHNPYFPGGGLSSYPYPSHMSMLGQGPGMSYNPYAMQSPMSNPMASSMSMLGGHSGIMGGGMSGGPSQMSQQSNMSNSSAPTPVTSDNTLTSSQAPPVTSSNQSNVPQMPMPFHPGMYGMAPNPLNPYPGMQPFMNTPSMYMPYGMPPMMPFGPMGGMGSPMQSQSSQMGNYGHNSYGQSMSQDGSNQDQTQGNANK